MTASVWFCGTKQVRNALPHPVGGTPGEEAPRAPHEDRGGQAEQEYGGGQATREPEADDRAGRLPHRDHDEAYDHRAEQRALPGIPPARPLLEVSAQRAQGRDASDLEQGQDREEQCDPQSQCETRCHCGRIHAETHVQWQEVAQDEGQGGLHAEAQRGSQNTSDQAECAGLEDVDREHLGLAGAEAAQNGCSVQLLCREHVYPCGDAHSAEKQGDESDQAKEAGQAPDAGTQLVAVLRDRLVAHASVAEELLVIRE